MSRIGTARLSNDLVCASNLAFIDGLADRFPLHSSDVSPVVGELLPGHVTHVRLPAGLLALDLPIALPKHKREFLSYLN